VNREVKVLATGLEKGRVLGRVVADI
jgi:hypothetical protein